MSAQFHDQDKLQSVLQECDMAISRAVEDGEDSSLEMNDLFEQTTRKLHDYHKDHHKSNAISQIDNPMKDAKNTDKRMKSKKLTKEKDMFEVKFRILRSLPPEENPTTVQQYLSRSSGLPEILWYFSHYELKDERRLALAKNPYFYNTLPTALAGYMGTQPIEFPNDLHFSAFDVLTNDCGRVFLERNPYPRIFDNLWDVNGILIFKDASGELEGGQSFPKVAAVWVCNQHPEPQPGPGWKVQIQGLWRDRLYSCIHIRAQDP